MATTKNLCAQIPIDLHERVSEERERLGQTTSEYIANLIQDYYNMMENQKGGIQMIEKGRTMAFQIPEELFQRIKRHLERETLRTGKKLTQRDFVLNLITQALDEADTRKSPPSSDGLIILPHPAKRCKCFFQFFSIFFENLFRPSYPPARASGRGSSTP
jgi:predicted DNA-binding protein